VVPNPNNIPDVLFSQPFLLKLERLTLVSRQTLVGRLQGERRSRKRGQSIEFSDFRPYVSGDDFRRIDWNAFARLERLFIKLFVEEEDLTVHLLIDTSLSMDWGSPNKLEYAIKSAGALGYISLLGLDRVTVTTSGNGAHDAIRLPELRGKQGALHLLKFLSSLMTEPHARPSATSENRVNNWLNVYAAKNIRKGLLLLFSDLLGDQWQSGLNALAARGYEIVVFHILSPDEINPNISGDFKLIDCETDESIEITSDYVLLDNYIQNLEKWRKSWRKFCSQRKVQYFMVETSLPLEDLLFSWLRTKGVIK